MIGARCCDHFVIWGREAFFLEIFLKCGFVIIDKKFIHVDFLEKRLEVAQNEAFGLLKSSIHIDRSY